VAFWLKSSLVSFLMDEKNAESSYPLGLPPLPKPCFRRVVIIEQVVKALLNAHQVSNDRVLELQNTHILNTEKKSLPTVLIHGFGGNGKTVCAQLSVLEPSIRSVWPSESRIVYEYIGPYRDPLSAFLSVYKKLTGETSQHIVNTLAEAYEMMRNCFSG